MVYVSNLNKPICVRSISSSIVFYIDKAPLKDTDIHTYNDSKTTDHAVSTTWALVNGMCVKTKDGRGFIIEEDKGLNFR